MSSRTSEMTRSWAAVRPKERPFRNGLRRLPSPRCLSPVSVLATRALRAARPAWIRKSSWKIRRRMAARRRARSVEGAVDERPHPAGLDVLVDGVNRHEAPGVRSLVTGPVVHDLDAFGGQLDPVAALDLARDHHPHLGM